MRLIGTGRNGMKQLIVKNVPADVHKAFKLACLKNDKSMAEVIIEFMRKYGDS